MKGLEKFWFFTKWRMCKVEVHFSLGKSSFFGYKKIYIFILNEWFKFESDRLNHFEDIMGTDFENVVMRKKRLKFEVLFYLYPLKAVSLKVVNLRK